MRTPWLTLALVLSIALGIGSNVSIYAFGRGLIEPNSPLTSMGGIVSIVAQGIHGEPSAFSYHEYLSLKHNLNSFEWIGTARVSPASIVIANQPAVASVAAVRSDLAQALHLPLQQGVVISHRMWQNEFGANVSVRGDQIDVGGVKTRVSGIAPAWLDGLYRDRDIDLWMPLRENTPQDANGNGPDFWILARLRHGVSIRQAQRAASGGITVFPYTGMTPEMTGGISRIATLFGISAGAVFLIACANVVSFLLGHAFARSHETSVRAALGASRRALVRELLCDSIVISMAGGAFGTLLAVWTSHVVPALLFDQDAERLIFAPDLASIVGASAVCAASPYYVALCRPLRVPIISRRPFSGVNALLGMLSHLLARITRANSLPAVWVWLLAPFVLTLAVIIASLLPARRAFLVNPIAIIRDEN